MIRLLIVLFTIGSCSPVFAHGDADWINQGGYRNSVGQFCCGEKDCHVTTAQSVSLPAYGYRLPDGLFIPLSQTLPSPDGQYWICAWGGQWKCFFAPPGMM